MFLNGSLAARELTVTSASQRSLITSAAIISNCYSSPANELRSEEALSTSLSSSETRVCSRVNTSYLKDVKTTHTSTHCRWINVVFDAFIL